MPRVLVAGKIHPSGLAVLEHAPNIMLDFIDTPDMGPFLEHLPEADGVLLRTQPLTRETIASNPQLKIVSRHGVGFDLVDVDALSARGIPLTIVGDVNSVAVAEHAMTLILAVGKRLRQMDSATRSGEWEYRNLYEPRELDGKSLLIVGFGRIGRRLKGMAEAFGMEVHVFDPFIDSERAANEGVKYHSDLGAALSGADYVSLHLPSIGSELIDQTALSHMRPTAILINAARGDLVDESAIVAALESGQLAGYGTDVFSVEPPDPADPLFRAENVVVTPHAAGLSLESAERMGIAAAQNIVDFFDSRLDSDLVVNAADIGR